MTRAILCLLLAVPLAASAEEATVPHKLGFTGRLLTAQGEPVTGAVNVTFALYDQAMLGTATWTETQKVAPSYEGVYSTFLGAANPIPDEVLLAPGQRFLEVTVENGPPLSPRLELGAAPYAAVAKHVRGGTVEASEVRADRVEAGTLTVGGSPLSLGYRSVRSFTGNGNFDVPAGITRVHVRAWGGGGAGGTIDSAASKPAGGGGAGGYAEDILEVAPGNTVGVTVGVGGNASACTASNGTDTTVTVAGQQRLIARGGQGGEHAQGATCCTAGKPTPKGGMGGTATGGIALAGESGWDASEGGGAGLNPMSPVYGRGGETVFNPLIPCTPGDAGKSGLVLVAY
jgi:hypothetical protein